MHKQPNVVIEKIKLLCPDCDTELTTEMVCGCEIDLSEITIDIQPEEILH
jgi:hypothetical protein